MWTIEQLKDQLSNSQAALKAIAAKINGYDEEIKRLSDQRSLEVQELLRLDGEARILKKQLDGEVK